MAVSGNGGPGGEDAGVLLRPADVRVRVVHAGAAEGGDARPFSHADPGPVGAGRFAPNRREMRTLSGPMDAPYRAGLPRRDRCRAAGLDRAGPSVRAAINPATMQDNNQIIKLFPGELGVEAFYTEREAVLPYPVIQGHQVHGSRVAIVERPGMTRAISDKACNL